MKKFSILIRTFPPKTGLFPLFRKQSLNFCKKTMHIKVGGGRRGGIIWLRKFSSGYFLSVSDLGEGVSRDDLDPGSVDDLDPGSEAREVGGLGGGWVGCWRIFCPSTDLDLWISEDLNSCIYQTINQ